MTNVHDSAEHVGCVHVDVALELEEVFFGGAGGFVGAVGGFQAADS